ncbi:MAG: NADH-quinone oxidoreductase subunit M [Streptosporangiales bacterium]|nr:NADH-quinone oxidoreductase subunit M [Streptosporangiales bacterium]MBO0891549.1 NADH-quinone oxidoreductase subunit M [Acidothermales bacterium]
MSALTGLLLLLPAAGAVVGCLAPRTAAVRVGLLAALLTVLDAAVMLAVFGYGASGVPQLELDWPWVPSIGLRFHLGVDGISLPLVVLTTVLVALCIVALRRYVPDPGHERALVVLVLVLEIGMLGTFLALDVIVFFVSFETVLLPMYAVVAIWGGPGRRAAANKFLLYTQLGSVVMLVGLLAAASYAGSFSIQQIVDHSGHGMSHTVQVLVFLAIAGGLAVKVPMWPLHSWLPDAHTEAPTVGSVLLAGVLLKMGTYGIVRIALPAAPEGAHALAPFLGAYAVVGIVYAALACLAQRDLKRLIAFSSVGHMGFVLLGIATLTPVGVNAALFGNIAHGVITGLLFFLAGAVKERYGTTDFAVLGPGMRAKIPHLAGFLAVASIASLGLPGFAGFWAELLALLGAWRPADGLPRTAYLVYLAVAGVGSVLTAAYFLAMLHRVAHGEVAARWRAVALPGVSAVELATWLPLVAAMVLAGVWPRTLLGLTEAAVQRLLGGG